MPEKLNVYDISYRWIFEDNPDYSVVLTALTAGKAKDSEYLSFSDAWEMTYMEFLKNITYRKIGQSSSIPSEPPFRKSERNDVVNKLIREIGSRSHQMFYSAKYDRFAEFF